MTNEIDVQSRPAISAGKARYGTRSSLPCTGQTSTGSWCIGSRQLRCRQGTWIFHEPVTSINLTEDRDLLTLVFASRIGLWSPRTHPRVVTIYELSAAPEMRFNDAGVDPRGSLWAGTMRNNVGPRGEDLGIGFSNGVLLRIDPDGTATEWKNGIGLSNTVASEPGPQAILLWRLRREYREPVCLRRSDRRYFKRAAFSQRL